MTDMKVELIDHMGSDLTVVNAARVSFAKESELVKATGTLRDADRKLIAYLAKHKHWTPFSHCQATFRIKAPIFVARQLFKHKVGLTENEVSRRYVDSEPEFYEPKAWRKRAENVKQGSSDDECFMAKAADHQVYTNEDGWLTVETMDYAKHALAAYKSLLEAGVCPEQARMVLPQSMMTEWWWTGSLSAFSRVHTSRTDPHAQQETRDVAHAIGFNLCKLYPESWKALTDA